VGRLWGVGRVTGKALDDLGIRTIGDVRKTALAALQRQFGKAGEHLWQLAHGIDARRVVPDREAKSVSHETTFPEDIDEIEVLRAWVLELAEQVGRRLRRHELRGRTVQIKVRFADFHTTTRAKTLPEPTNITGEIRRTAAELLEGCCSPRPRPIRLLGVGVTGFESRRQTQPSLFADEEREKQTQLDLAADRIRERFGSAALHRASGLHHEAQHTPLPRPEPVRPDAREANDKGRRDNR
jgi:DNA polymerase-4